MSAQIRIMPTEEADKGFALLRDIVEMTKNPKAIEQAYEARRKAAALTDDEIAKAEAARVLISKADDLQADIDKKQSVIDMQKEEHIKNIAAFEEKMKILDTRAEELASISAQHEQISKNNEQEKIRIQESAQQIESDRAKRESDVSARENALKEKEATAQKENERLISWESKIKTKAKKLAAEASDW
jgi:hypothetical protein